MLGGAGAEPLHWLRLRPKSTGSATLRASRVFFKLSRSRNLKAILALDPAWQNLANPKFVPVLESWDRSDPRFLSGAGAEIFGWLLVFLWKDGSAVTINFILLLKPFL